LARFMRRAYINLEARLHRAAEAAANIGKGFGASGASVEQKRALQEEGWGW
jgi:hypothetical protein